MTQHRLIIKYTSTNTIGYILSTLINFLYYSLLVRYLGVENYGLIVIANIFSIIGLISLLDIGLPGSINRYCSILFKKGNSLKLSYVYTYTMILFALIGVLAVLISHLFFVDLYSTHFDKDSSLKGAIYIVLFSLPYQFPLLLVKSYYKALEKYSSLHIVLISVDLLKLGLTVIASQYEADNIDILLISSYIHLISFVLLIYNLPIKPIFIFRVKYFILFFRRLYKLSFYIFIQRISSVLYSSTDKIFASIILGPIAAATIDVLSKIPLIVNKMLGLSVSAIVPSLSLTNTNSVVEMHKVSIIFMNGTRFYAFILYPLISILFFNSADIFEKWLVVSDPVIIQGFEYLLFWSLLFPFYFGGTILVALNRFVREYSITLFSLPILKIFFILFFSSEIEIIHFPLSYLFSSLPIIYLLYIYRLVFGNFIVKVSYFLVLTFSFSFGVYYLLSLVDNFYLHNILFTFCYLLIMLVLGVTNSERLYILNKLRGFSIVKF